LKTFGDLIWGFPKVGHVEVLKKKPFSQMAGFTSID